MVRGCSKPLPPTRQKSQGPGLWSIIRWLVIVMVSGDPQGHTQQGMTRHAMLGSSESYKTESPRNLQIPEMSQLLADSDFSHCSDTGFLDFLYMDLYLKSANSQHFSFSFPYSQDKKKVPFEIIGHTVYF